MYKSVTGALVALLFLAAVVGCGTQTPQAPKQETPTFSASVKKLDEMTVASTAGIGPYHAAGAAIVELVTWAGNAKVPPMSAPFAVYLTGPEVPQESAKWEACMGVPADLKGDAKVLVKQMAAMEIAATRHVGPYDKVGPVYEQLAQWVSENGYEVAGPALEFYLTNPQTTPAESSQTEVAFIVKAKAAPAPAEGAGEETGK